VVSFGYVGRLLCISLASYFLISAVLSLLVSVLAPLVIRMAERMAPRFGARLLLAVRLLPLLSALLFVGSLCVPSYLWLEPDIATERAGMGSVVLSLMGLVLGGYSLWRSGRALVKSRGFVRSCLTHATPALLSGWRKEAWLIESPRPVLALAGIVRPRLIVSRFLLDELDETALSVALRHEQAHLSSRDNLKSFVVLLAPDLFPVLSGFRRIEASRARLTEWAADDRAVAGSTADSVSLAEALVRCARLGSPGAVPALTSSLLCCNQDLAVRVGRLLEVRQRGQHEHTVRVLALLLAGLALAFFLQSGALLGVHQLVELLME
jgi:beta-lactamase regulating signal transducer with metallopeptidase domain